MREIDVERYLVRRVRKVGGLCPKHVHPGERGWPDRIVILPHTPACWVEVKQTPGVVSRAQWRIMAALRRLGVRVEVVRSREDVDALLRSLGHDE